MVQYLHFRILKFPLIIDGLDGVPLENRFLTDSGNPCAHFWSATGRNGDGETSALLNRYMSSSQKFGFEPSIIICYKIQSHIEPNEV